MFCLKFESVVNRAFLVLINWAKNAVGATLFTFCNYAFSGPIYDINFAKCPLALLSQVSSL